MAMGLTAACTGLRGTAPVPTEPASQASSETNVDLSAADLALEQGSLEKAETAYREAIAANPTLAEAYFGLGNVLMRKGQLVEAEQAYLSAIRFDPNLGAAHSNLGVVYYQQEELDKAAGAFSAALKAEPSDAATTYLLAAVRLQQDNLVDAERLLIQARDLDPYLPEVYYGLGVLYRLKGQRDDAIAAFRKYLDIGPGQDPAGMDYARNELRSLGVMP